MEGDAGKKFTVILDSQLRVLRAPEALAELLGTELGSLRETGWQSLVVEDASSFVPKEAGTISRRSGYLKCSSGEIVEASFAAELVPRTEGLVCIEIAVRDTSNARRDIVDRESLDFLTTVSHELRVALNGVIGFANVLNGTSLDSDQLSVLEKLQSCNHMLKGLINDILEYSRAANSKINLRSETVQVDAFVEEVAGLFRDRAAKKGLDLKVVSGPDAQICAELPKMRMTQVLSNLIANAIKLTARGWVSVSVSCRNRVVCIGVQDTGPGVDLNLGDAVFRPFFQLDDNFVAPEGTGLGLAISKELVSKMGGSLVLRRPDEGGSLFEFTVPIGEEAAFVEIDDASTSGEVAASGSRISDRDLSKRILVVEDNQLNADILGHFLQDYGVCYDHVDNGLSAVDVYQDGKYDLILMDVMLPELNGYEATERILKKSRLSHPVPIVGVTAKVFRRDQLRCVESGMIDVVHKPVDFKLLRKVLDQHLYSVRGDGSSCDLVESSESQSLGDEVEKAGSAARSMGDRDCMDAATLEAYIDRMKTPDTDRAQIVSTAISIVDAEMESLLRSIDSCDRKEVGMRAHSLKGALALLGARNILDLAKGLELIASDGRVPLKSEHWKSLVSNAYAEFRSELQRYVATTLVD